MDIALLAAKVQTSPLLSDAERQYWISNLPHMTPPQILKLERILTEAEGLTWNDDMQQYISLATKAVLPAAA